jgi:putative resolvase
MSYITMQKASRLFGVTVNTIRRWTDCGKLSYIRTVGNHRKISMLDVNRLLDIDMPVEIEHITRDNSRVVCYGRVSTSDQKKHGDLTRQQERLVSYCLNKQYAIHSVLSDVCSGIKTERTNLNKLFTLIVNKEIDIVVIEHKDRLTRFMFDIYKTFFNSYGVTIECVEDSLPKSFENELVEDMLSLITVFSARLYSRRKRQSRNAHKSVN